MKTRTQDIMTRIKQYRHTLAFQGRQRSREDRLVSLATAVYEEIGGQVLGGGGGVGGGGGMSYKNKK